MRADSLRLATIVLIASAASGQTPADQSVEKVFHFAHTETAQGFQELTNAIRAIAQVPQAALVTESKALAVRGTASQVAMAEWLFRGLDKPAGAQTPARLEYPVPGAGNELARIFYMAHTTTPLGLQEITNAIRSITEVRWVSVCNGPWALAVRATTAQIALADWLIQGVDKPAGSGPFGTISQTLTAPELRSRDGSAMVARVLYPAHMESPQHLQETVNMIRSIAELQRVLSFNAIRAIVVRGEPDQVALAEWLVNALGRPTTAEGPALKPPRPDMNFVTRMFYLANISTPQAAQDVVNVIRTRTQVQRAALYAPARAISVRGTANQIALAERLIQELDRPPVP